MTDPSQLSEAEGDVLDSIVTAIMDDPDPRSGRTYWAGDGAPYQAARQLVDRGLAFVVSGGFVPGCSVHVGATPQGCKRWSR